MRKHWVMVAVFLAAGIMACQSNQDTRPNPEPAKQKQPAFHPTNREQGQAKAGNDKAKPDGISQRRDASFKWPEWMGDSNWWVVIIAALTGSVIGLQGWETRKAAQAGKISAKAALAQINLMKDKERAHLFVEIKRPEVFSLDKAYPIEYAITLSGPTAATIIKHEILVQFPGSQPKPLLADALPQNFTPEMRVVDGYSLFHFPPFDRGKNDSVIVKGYILYQDVFGDVRRRKIHLGWWGDNSKGWDRLGKNQNGEEKADRNKQLEA
jgi:hypothetical protein